MYLPMSSNKYTMKDIENSEKIWKFYVAENEIRLLQTYKNNDELHLAYDKAEKNAWIVRTLRDKKQRYLFNTCKNLIMIGSGIYPYSMFDVHRQYPHINQIGLEIVEARAILSRKLVEASPAKDKITILCKDAINYDYSWLGHDDLIFISVDVDHNKIVEKVLKTSKAHINVCAPYDKTWLKNLVRSFS